MAYKIVGIIALAALSTLSSSAFADVLYDCGLVTGNPTSALESLKIKGVSPLSKDDMNASMNNLKAYCCQQKVFKDACEGSEGNDKNPESPYIFDQFVSQ